MAVTLTGTGGLFTRLGKFITEINRVVSGYGTALNSGVEAIWDQFPNSQEDAIAIDGLTTARDSYRTVHTSYLGTLQNCAKNTVVEQVNRDTSLASKTLTPALTELKRQMVSSSDSINRPTTSATVTPYASNKGNAVVNVSLTNEYGDPLDMVFPETIKLTVVGDVSNGGTQYAETLSIQGQPLRTEFNYQWPGGSSAAGTMYITNAETTDLLTDGGFESWGGSGNNTPTYWTIATGTAGTHIFREATEKLKSNYGMKMTSDGSTLVAFKQQLATTVLPNKVYALNLWAKMSALDASGIVRFRLCNSSGTTLTDDAGTNLSYTRNMNGNIGTSFTQVSTFFSTPRQLPATGGVFLEVAFTTSPTSGRSLYIDQLGLKAASQLYPGGPFCAAFSKDTSNANGDYYSIAITNSLTYNSFAVALDRLFGMRTLGIYLPSSGSPTINDNLIS